MSLRSLLTPSFRSRLRLFFVVSVVVPMLTMVVVLFALVIRTEESNTDARLSTALVVATRVLTEERTEAGNVASRIATDQPLADARAERDRRAVRARLQALTDRESAQYVDLRLDDFGTFDAGELPAVAPAERPLETEQRVRRGEITVAMLSPEEYGRRVEDLTGASVVMFMDGERIESSAAGVPADVPDEGSVMVDGDKNRVRGFTAPAVGGDVEIRLLLDEQDTASLRDGTTILAVLAVIAFLVLGAIFAVAISRRLQSEIQRLLVAAKRLGRGDFSVDVPVDGADEFAALGREFNSMARQLEAQIEELQRERSRLEESFRRVGESFAAGLDRVGVMEIVVQTAVEGIGAAAGRASMRGPDNRLQEVARTGRPQDFERALHASEAAVIDAGQIAEIQLGDVSALAAPLGSVEESDQVIGIVSVARGYRAFTHGERDLFAYLTSGAAVSVENVDLHETVQRQAVTDELTGLFNHRRFQEVVAAEVERARRYNQEMGLIMLDIDNFKQVNDTYGHIQGDTVLREVARVLRHSSREIDEPARYGGEEMAVALPQTDLEGAYRFAERVRRRIAALELPLAGGGNLRVTASFGVASLNTAATADKDALVAAADGALYEAKRAGKNQTVRATGSARRPRDVHGVASAE
jgi:diguanylate cyclase (GGDEF)-like protein